MKYTVRWLPFAESDLADLWVNSARRAAVTQAAHAIDQTLERSPHDVGESRSNGMRILFEKPLAVLYRVREGDRLVEVGHVWEFR